MTAVRRRPHRDERGASLVEFALILPLFMMLVLGTFTGGIAYNTKQSITSGAREGSRYGATLPLAVDSSCNPSGTTAQIDNWLKCVSDLAATAASGELNVGSSGRYICVSFVASSGSSTATKSRYVTDSGGVETVSTSTSDCYTLNGLAADGMPTSLSRVQIVTKRTRNLQWLLSSSNLNLSAASVTLFEAT